jgi:hypothetical protein
MFDAFKKPRAKRGPNLHPFGIAAALVRSVLP